jgi:hypothetical protein
MPHETLYHHQHHAGHVLAVFQLTVHNDAELDELSQFLGAFHRKHRQHLAPARDFAPEAPKHHEAPAQHHLTSAPAQHVTSAPAQHHLTSAPVHHTQAPVQAPQQKPWKEVLAELTPHVNAGKYGWHQVFAHVTRHLGDASSQPDPVTSHKIYSDILAEIGHRQAA